MSITIPKTGRLGRSLVALAVASTAGVALAAPAAASSADLPSPPGSVTAVAGDARITVSWQPPASSGSSAITGYTAVCGSRSTTTPAASRSAVVTGLVDGQSYRCVVFASNASGDGPGAAASGTVVPRGAPDAVTGITNVLANRKIIVQWTPATPSPGAPIDGEKVTCASPDGGKSLNQSYDYYGYDKTTFTAPTLNATYRCSVTTIGPAGQSTAYASSWIEQMSFTGAAGSATATLNITATAGQQIAGVLDGSSLSSSGTAKLLGNGGAVLAQTATPPANQGKVVGAATVASGGATAVTVTVPAGTTGLLRVAAYAYPALTGTLTSGRTTPASLAFPGRGARFTFSGTAGQQVSVLIGNPLGKGTGSARLLAPDGTELRYTPEFDGAFLDATTLPVNGTYAVTVDPQLRPTDFTLTLYTVPANTGTVSIDGAASGVTIGVPGQNPTRTFTATAGEKITAGFANSTIGGGRLSVRNAAGAVLGSVALVDDASSMRHATGTITIPNAGTYTVLVDPVYADTGQTDVSVSST